MAASPSQDETARGTDAALQALIQLSRDFSGTLRPTDIARPLAPALERWMRRLGGQEFHEELVCKNPAIAQRVAFHVMSPPA